METPMIHTRGFQTSGLMNGLIFMYYYYLSGEGGGGPVGISCHWLDGPSRALREGALCVFAVYLDFAEIESSAKKCPKHTHTHT